MEPSNLAKAFFLWSRTFCEEQAEVGFPLLANLPSSHARAFCEAFKDVEDASARSRYLQLQLRIWQGPASPEGELTEDERKELRPFQSRVQWCSAILGARNKWPLKKVAVKGLRRVLRAALPEQLGEILEDDGQEWLHRLQVGRVAVCTEIDLGGYDQMRMEHFVRDSSGAVIVPGFSLTGWMGLGTMAFDLLQPDQATYAASVVLSSALLFIDAIRELAHEYP